MKKILILNIVFIVLVMLVNIFISVLSRDIIFLDKISISSYKLNILSQIFTLVLSTIMLVFNFKKLRDKQNQYKLLTGVFIFISVLGVGFSLFLILAIEAFKNFRFI